MSAAPKHRKNERGDSGKPLAEAAAAGSLEDFRELGALLEDLPDSCNMHLLPVIFLNLDPAAIPDAHELDVLCAALDPMPRIECALRMGWKGVMYSDLRWPPETVFPKVIDILFLLTEFMDQGINFDEIVEGVGAMCVAGQFLCAGLGLFIDARAILFETVLRMRLVPTLITAILTFHGTPAGGHAVEMCFLYLAMALVNPPGYFRGLVKHASASIKNGYEPAGQHDHRTSDQILPRALVHYEAVLSLKQTFLDDSRGSDVGISTSPFAKAWQHFSWLAKRGWNFYNPGRNVRENGREAQVQVLFHVPECRLLFEKLSSGRLARWAQRCVQRIAGLPTTTAKEHPETLSTRGRCFLRELLSDDYFRHLTPISIQHVKFMYEHPGEAFFTAFAYSDAGDVQVEVQPTANLKMAGAWDVGMSTQFSRAEKSGRTDIHLMLLFEGQRFRQMVFQCALIRLNCKTGLFEFSGNSPGKRLKLGSCDFIVSCAVKYARGPQMEGTNIYEELTWIMKTILAQSLVWEVQSSPEMEEFTQVPLFSEWTTLATLVGQRAGGLNSWKSAVWKYQGKARLKALCTLHKHLLLTTPPTAKGGCQSSEQYHPHRVQSVAFNFSLTVFFSPDSFDKQFHRNERAFMNALIDADYKSASPQPDAYLVHFNYTHHTGVRSPSEHDRRPRAVCLAQKPSATWRLRRVWGGMHSTFFLCERAARLSMPGLHCIAEEIPAQADESWVENKATARRNQGPAGETDTLEERNRDVKNWEAAAKVVQKKQRFVAYDNRASTQTK
ncbi:hypothetical protein B0H13DRAFT_1925561 [Mycena leptocephala]|nr:hypothetical protein B0H13DRAFT_1925561 [Mycena leptocephala]